MLTFLMIGAHPDDMDLRCGGLASLLSRQGHRVIFLSMANGNGGHMTMDRESLRLRRRGEMAAAAQVYGVQYETLDVDDGCLTADLATRNALMRYIRRAKPDAIITHRTGDYHPDHRACGQLVMDCSYLVGVPLICPDVPALRKNPVILYCEDKFSAPAPFRPDVAVRCDEVIDQKIEGVLKHESQLYEWLPYDRNWEDVLSSKTREEATRRLQERMRVRFSGPVQRFPDAFPAGTQYGEAFQIDEYGGEMTEEVLRAMTAGNGIQ